MNDLKKALENNDAPSIKRTLEALDAAQMKAGQAMYSGQAGEAGGAGAEGAGSAGASSGGNNDDVIDAEVVEEKK